MEAGPLRGQEAGHVGSTWHQGGVPRRFQSLIHGLSRRQDTTSISTITLSLRRSFRHPARCGEEVQDIPGTRHWCLRASKISTLVLVVSIPCPSPARVVRGGTSRRNIYRQAEALTNIHVRFHISGHLLLEGALQGPDVDHGQENELAEGARSTLKRAQDPYFERKKWPGSPDGHYGHRD